jgi:hypothetical protein
MASSMLLYVLHGKHIGSCMAKLFLHTEENNINITETNITESEDQVTEPEPEPPVPIVNSTINISSNAFPKDVDSSYVLNLYSTPILFPLRLEDTNQTTIVDSEVLGFTIPREDNVANVANVTVVITLQSLAARNGSVSCVLIHLKLTI